MSAMIASAATLAALMGLSPIAPPAVKTQETLIVNLEADDLAQAAEGLGEQYFNKPLSGAIDDKAINGMLSRGLMLSDIRYSFRLEQLEILPDHGFLSFHATVSDLIVTIGTLQVGHNPNRVCQNLRITSRDAAIDADAIFVPRVVNERLQFSVPSLNLDLDRHNFRAERLEECHVARTLNGLIERAIPKIINLSRTRIEKTIKEAIAQQISQLGDQLNERITTRLSLPLKSMNGMQTVADLNLFPQRLEVTPEHLAFVLGSHLALRKISTHEDAKDPGLAIEAGPNLDPSYVGISTEFITAALTAGNQMGLLHAEITGTNTPQLRPLLNATSLKTFISGATFLQGSDEVTLNILGADSLALLTQPGATPEQLAQPVMQVKGLRLRFDVGEVPYLHVTLDGDIVLNVAVHPETKRLELRLQEVKNLHALPIFSDPSSTATFSEAAFLRLVTYIARRVIGPAPLFSQELPPLQLGSRRLGVTGAGIKDGFVIISGKVAAI